MEYDQFVGEVLKSGDKSELREFDYESLSRVTNRVCKAVYGVKTKDAVKKAQQQAYKCKIKVDWKEQTKMAEGEIAVKVQEKAVEEPEPVIKDVANEDIIEEAAGVQAVIEDAKQEEVSEEEVVYLPFASEESLIVENAILRQAVHTAELQGLFSGIVIGQSLLVIGLLVLFGVRWLIK